MLFKQYIAAEAFKLKMSISMIVMVLWFKANIILTFAVLYEIFFEMAWKVGKLHYMWHLKPPFTSYSEPFQPNIYRCVTQMRFNMFYHDIMNVYISFAVVYYLLPISDVVIIVFRYFSFECNSWRRFLFDKCLSWIK